MKTVGIIQSNYLPWRGYFDFIKSCDVFIFLEDVQYTKRDWRNRNLIKNKEGVQWITIPVIFSRKNPTDICATPINYALPWVQEHKVAITSAYGKAPYFSFYSKELFFILDQHFASISELNISLIKWAMEKLNIHTELGFSRIDGMKEEKSAKLLRLVQHFGGTKYLSGPAAKDYLDEDIFKAANIAVEYKKYKYPEYTQLYSPFEGTLSIVDLLFNVGAESFRYIECQD